MGSRPRLRARLVLALVAVAVALGTVEVAVRWAGVTVPALLPFSIRATYRVGVPGARFIYRGFLPGAFEDFANPVELNALGFHARSVPSERPAAATWRLMILGDSYVAALEVPVGETFPSRIEDRLAAEDPFGRGSHQVIAIGQGNRAQEAELEWLRRFGPVYRPDAVLLVFFCGNDVMENSPELHRQARAFGKRYVATVVPRKARIFERLLVFPQSRLNAVLAEAATSLYAANLHRFADDIDAKDLTSPELGIYRVPLAPEWDEAWRRTANLLDRIREEAARLGARFATASIAGPQAVGDRGSWLLWRRNEPGMDYERPERWIAEWAAARGTAHLALGPRLETAGRRTVFWPHDAHLTPAGHEVIAGALYPFLFGERGAFRDR